MTSLSKNEIKLRILNEHNIQITKEFVNSIFAMIDFDHTVIDLDNYQEAMIHESYLESNLTNQKTIKMLRDVSPIDPNLEIKCMPLQTKSYERLEFLGDSIIRHALGKYLFLRYPGEDEGFLTANRSKMENKVALSQLAKKIGIQNYAVISKNIEESNGRTLFVNITEDIFEAFIGAVDIEIGDNRCVEFIFKMIEKLLDVTETIRTKKNYKDMLMQIFHKIDGTRHDVCYQDSEIEINNKKKYKTIVIEKDTGRKLGIAIGRSKKTSQQRAARDALIKMNVIHNSIDKDSCDEYYEYSGNYDAELSKVRSILIK